MTYHAVMSSERPLPRGSEALIHIEKVARATKAQCVIVDTVQAILNPAPQIRIMKQLLGAILESWLQAQDCNHCSASCKKTTDVSMAPLEKVIGSIGQPYS